MQLLTEDPDFELDVLRTLLSDYSLMLGCYQALKPEYLLEATTQYAWGNIISYFTEYRIMPTKAVLRDVTMLAYSGANEKEKRQRDEALAVVDKLFQAPKASPDYIAARLAKFLRDKALVKAIEDTVDDISGGKEVTNEVVQRFEGALRAGMRKTDIGTRIVGDTETVIRNECDPTWRPPVPTGLIHFDAELGGGLRGGELGMLMAPPKGFKSGTMLNFCFNAAKRGVGVNALYVTLELSEHLTTLRFGLRTTMQTKHDMLRNPEAFLRYWDVRAANIFQPGKNIFVKYFDAYKFTPKTLDDFLEMAKREYGIEFGVIVIDYLNLVGADVKKDKDYLERVLIATDLRSVGHKWGCPIWTAVRANREEQSSKTPSMKHVASSYEWIGICDTCYALRRYRREGTLHLIPVATRNEGGNHRVICRCDPGYMFLSSIGIEAMPDEDDEEEKPNRRGGKKDDDADGIEKTAADIRKARKKGDIK